LPYCLGFGVWGLWLFETATRPFYIYASSLSFSFCYQR
jgi:hypothetical protein